MRILNLVGWSEKCLNFVFSSLILLLMKIYFHNLWGFKKCLEITLDPQLPQAVTYRINPLIFKIIVKVTLKIFYIYVCKTNAYIKVYNKISSSYERLPYYNRVICYQYSQLPFHLLFALLDMDFRFREHSRVTMQVYRLCGVRKMSKQKTNKKRRKIEEKAGRRFSKNRLLGS